jgi:hypothetical protein
METNTLVRHKKNRQLGIGCVSKVLSKSVKVNWGFNDTGTCTESQLEIVDTSKCRTVSMRKFADRILHEKSTLDYVIVGNEVKQYVGIGWITLHVVTDEDLKKYPRVVDK